MDNIIHVNLGKFVCISTNRWGSMYSLQSEETKIILPDKDGSEGFTHSVVEAHPNIVPLHKKFGLIGGGFWRWNSKHDQKISVYGRSYRIDY